MKTSELFLIILLITSFLIFIFTILSQKQAIEKKENKTTQPKYYGKKCIKNGCNNESKGYGGYSSYCISCGCDKAYGM